MLRSALEWLRHFTPKLLSSRGASYCDVSAQAMKKIILFTLVISLSAFSNEIVIEGIRERLRDFEPVCDGKPIPEKDREPSPRIADTSFTEEQNEKILSQYNKEVKAGNKCLSEFLDNYRNTIYAYCEKYNVSACIAGGCQHTVGYSITTPVLEKALEYCENKH